MKKPVKNTTKNSKNVSSKSLKETEAIKKQKTRKKLFLSIGGIVLSAAVVTSLTIGIAIAKKEVK